MRVIDYRYNKGNASINYVMLKGEGGRTYRDIGGREDREIIYIILKIYKFLLGLV